MKAKIQKPGATCGEKVKVDQAFKVKHGLTYSGQKPANAVKNISLRRLEQDPYEHIISLSQTGSKKFLIDAGVVLKPGAKSPAPNASFLCWIVDSPMTPCDESQRLKCNRNSCSMKPKLYNPEIAYTPWAAQASGGYDGDYQLCGKAQKRLKALETTKCVLPEDMQPGTSIISLQQ